MMIIIILIVIFNFTFQIKSLVVFNIKNIFFSNIVIILLIILIIIKIIIFRKKKNNIFNINTFDYSKNNNIPNPNNTIFNTKNI